MSKPRIACLLALVLIVVGLLFLPSSRKGPPPSPTQAKGINLCGYDEETEPSWRVKAREGTLTDKSGSLSHVEISFYDTGERSLWAIAESLAFDGEKAVLQGGVTMARNDDYRMCTEQATWNQATKELTAREIRISAERIAVDAQGFSYHLEHKGFSIRDGFVAEIDLPKRLSIVGETIREEEGELILQGELWVQGKREEYRCGRIDYDGSGEVVMSAGVTGSFPTGNLRAGVVTLSADGRIVAREGVQLLLETGFFTDEYGT